MPLLRETLPRPLNAGGTGRRPYIRAGLLYLRRILATGSGPDLQLVLYHTFHHRPRAGHTAPCYRVPGHRPGAGPGALQPPDRHHAEFH